MHAEMMQMWGSIQAAIEWDSSEKKNLVDCWKSSVMF